MHDDSVSMLLVYLPCRAATSLGLGMALVVPSPNCPSSLSPQVYTSPTTPQYTSTNAHNPYLTYHHILLVLPDLAY